MCPLCLDCFSSWYLHEDILTEHLISPRYYFKHLTYIRSFNLHNYPLVVQIRKLMD